MNTKGTGKLQAKIIEQLHGTPQRYTSAALRICINAKNGSMDKSLSALLEIGAIKADPWRTGYVYRSPHSERTADVMEVKMRPQLVTTRP